MTLPQVLVDNLVDIHLVHVGVPNALGVNHHDRPFLATVHAACLVDADTALAIHAQRLDAFLGMVAHLLCGMVGATGAAILALVHAEKNMITVIGHGPGSCAYQATNDNVAEL